MQDSESMELARRALHHLNNRTTDQADSVMRVPAASYTDPAIYRREVNRLFEQLPLALAFSVELPGPQTYRAMTVMGIPILLVRAEDSQVRAFINVCKHRGSQLCKPGHGTARRLVCPYHAWQYDLHGKLQGVYGAATFGEIDPEANSLTELHCTERAGLIWATVTPGVAFDIDEWLGPMAQQLLFADLGNWHIHVQREFCGPGWKTAWDGYLESYHHSIVHGGSLAKYTVGNLVVHDTYGYHQRMVFGRRTLESLNQLPDNQWDPDEHIRRVFHMFPNVAISVVLGNYCLVNQIFPGATQETSVTRQTILAVRKPETDEERQLADEFAETTIRAIRDEDYPINFTVQESLKSGRQDCVLFGRNEPALQHFHRTIAHFMEDLQGSV
ncbi:MAG: aromatic ring-hydroxylating dioxygenase subunit alpha [Burkholderiaceae bacterium]